MIKNVLTSMGGVEVYGVISVCLFFTVFSVAMIFALGMKKSLAQRMGALPLEDAPAATQEKLHE